MLKATLTPIHIKREDKSYLPVERLRESLQDDCIHNIALTGPFGSGKSSVIRTLVDEEKGNYNFLEISLATLDVKKTVKSKAEEEILSKKIELGILQQLVYREKDSTLPYSRFRRIHFFENDEVTRYVIMALLAVVSFAIAFEPKWLRIDSLYELFNLGGWNIIFDIIALFYLFLFSWILLHWLIEKYWGSKFSKLNITDGEIEVKESGSIFNEHLEEILYFFQATNYNVVILEDLDRFDNPEVFLKLRELNYLLNHSKVMKQRKFVFIYAVKDDLFKDTSRTKFFDFIIPVIPIMNVSNACDLLKGELSDMGYSDIDDEEMEDIAGFIDDMRILHNISNEYQQYREQLMAGSTKLNSTKLLALIVYKNYYPEEFALMHHQKGRIAELISRKKDIIEHVRDDVLSKQRDEIKKAYEIKQANSHLKMKDLRTLYIYAYRMAIKDQEFAKFVINNTVYNDEDIINDNKLFENLITNKTVYYKRKNTISFLSQTIDFKELEKSVSDVPYKTRKTMIMADLEVFDSEMEDLQRQEDELNTYSLKMLMMQFPIVEMDTFMAIKLKPMEELFLLRGYIEDDYYDYISYFYPGMITENDRQLLLDMKLGRKSSIDRRIDKIDNFVQKMPVSIYRTPSILNLQVVDWLARHHDTRKLSLVVNQIRASQHGVSFLAAFNREKWQYRDEVNKIYMHRYADQSWINLSQCDIQKDKDTLRSIWFKWASNKDIREEQREWLNENYDFISKNIQGIGLTKAVEILADCKVRLLDNKSPDLFDAVVRLSCYEINPENLLLIYNHYTKESIEPRALTLAKLGEVNIAEFQDEINKRPNDVIKALITTKDEPIHTQLKIINDERINSQLCLDYVSKQTLMIDIIEKVVVEERIKPLYDTDSVLPRWDNILFYIRKYDTDPILFNYIHRHIYVLMASKMNLDSEERHLLCQKIMFDNNLQFVDFEKLVVFFNYSIDEKDMDDLSELNHERLLFMLRKGKIKYSKELRDWLFDKPLYPDYMIYHKKHLLKDYKQIEYNKGLAERIMVSKDLRNNQKMMMIPYFPVGVLTSAADLANNLCRFLLKHELILKRTQIEAIIQTCTIESDRINFAASAILAYKNDKKFINNLLVTLGDRYLVFVHKGNPRIGKNDYDMRMVSALETAGYISSIKDMGDYIRVYSKK